MIHACVEKIQDNKMINADSVSFCIFIYVCVVVLKHFDQ